MKFGHHGDLTLKSDQEPAIVDLLRAVAKLRGNNRTNLENSPVGDSAGNGFIENAVQRVEKLLRVHKLDLERRLGEKLSVKHPIFAWLVEHIADVLNKYWIGTDGKTPYQRMKGKTSSQHTV